MKIIFQLLQDFIYAVYQVFYVDPKHKYDRIDIRDTDEQNLSRIDQN